MTARAHLPLALLLGLVVRVPFWSEALRTPVDGDTAIIGLMAQHPFASTTMWGQPYGSPVEAWLAWPFVATLGPRAESLRLFYFLAGLGLVPIAYFLAAALDRRAALPAAVLMACPPPYFLLLASLPPPLYPTTLLACGLLLLLTLGTAERLAAGQRPLARLAAAGLLAGLALWTHLMAASVIAACSGYLWWRARRRRRLLLAALVPLLAASAPWWLRAAAGEEDATRIVAVSGRAANLARHLREVLPRLDEPIGGVLGTQVPIVADDAEAVLVGPGWRAGGIILVYGFALIVAARAAVRQPRAWLLFAAAALCVLAFPFPLRSGPATLRFLSPLFLPIGVLAAWAPVAYGHLRRSWIVVLSLAVFHMTGATALLSAWRSADRAEPPFLLPDLAPLRRFLEAHGLRHVYASYGPAWRLTFESGERIVASQPWNERFRHHPLPYLDEVRFAKDVAWVLTPRIPTDLPAPHAFAAALAEIGGDSRRESVGAAVVHFGFAAPFSPLVEAEATLGAAGDGDPATGIAPSAAAPTTWALPAPRPLDAITLVARLGGARLLRSMDVEVSSDGAAFETVASRRRRQERGDLRWVDGVPRYVLDHDLIAIPLAGRVVGAIRISPYESGDAWELGELLLHPAREPSQRAPWDEWLDPRLGWSERRRALFANPRRDRADWYGRMLIAGGGG